MIRRLGLRWVQVATRTFWALCLLPSALAAQLTNDVVPRERTIPVREEIEREMSDSRFRLGPVRILPQIAIVGPSYDNNIFGASEGEEKVTDWTVTARAGVNLLVPMGKKLYLRGTVFPEYIWYNRLEERRQWGGTYGGAFYAFFNRLSFQADYSTSLTPVYPNSEIQTQVLGDSDQFDGKLEVQISGPISLVGAGTYLKSAYRPLGEAPPDAAAELALLDREEWAARGGLRYRFNSYFDVVVGVEGTQAEFPDQSGQADNQSTAYLAGVAYSVTKLFVNFNGGYRIGKARNGSSFPEFDSFTGSGYVTYQLAGPISISGYGRRGLEYGLFLDNPYYMASVGGGGLSFQIGRRLTLSGFGEYGTNVYPIPVIVEGLGEVVREDKITTYGGGIAIWIIKGLSLSATAQNSEYVSNVPGFDRSVFRFTSSLVLGALGP